MFDFCCGARKTKEAPPGVFLSIFPLEILHFKMEKMLYARCQRKIKAFRELSGLFKGGVISHLKNELGKNTGIKIIKKLFFKINMLINSPKNRPQSGGGGGVMEAIFQPGGHTFFRYFYDTKKVKTQTIWVRKRRDRVFRSFRLLMILKLLP